MRKKEETTPETPFVRIGNNKYFVDTEQRTYISETTLMYLEN